MKTTYSVEIKDTMYTDDIFNGSFEECVEYIKENGTVKAVQVAALRTALEAGPMTQAKMISILVNSQPGRKQEQKITLSEKKLRNFFPEKYTAEDMESVILELLDQWKRGEITV